jgi:hypothetical protein
MIYGRKQTLNYPNTLNNAAAERLDILTRFRKLSGGLKRLGFFYSAAIQTVYAG